MPNYGYGDIVRAKDRAELLSRLDAAHRDEQAIFIQFELHHRDAEEQANRMEAYTRQMTTLTKVITVLTF